MEVNGTFGLSGDVYSLCGEGGGGGGGGGLVLSLSRRQGSRHLLIGGSNPLRPKVALEEKRKTIRPVGIPNSTGTLPEPSLKAGPNHPHV